MSIVSFHLQIFIKLSRSCGFSLLLLKRKMSLKCCSLRRHMKPAPKLTLVAFEPVVSLSLVVKLKILRFFLVQAVFQREVIEERTVLFGYLRACRYTATHNNAEAVVPQSLRELEGIVGVQTARSIGSALHIGCNVYAHRVQGTARNSVHLVLQEAIRHRSWLYSLLRCCCRRGTYPKQAW